MHSPLLLLTAVSAVTAAPILDGLLSPLGLDDVTAAPQKLLNLVFTTAQNGMQSLSVLDDAGKNLLGNTCSSKLDSGAFADTPIDFSNVNLNGDGSFLFGNQKFSVDSLLNGDGPLKCVKEVADTAAAVRCLVPAVEGFVGDTVSDVTGLVSCLTKGLPLVGDLLDLGDLGNLPGLDAVTGILGSLGGGSGLLG